MSAHRSAVIKVMIAAALISNEFAVSEAHCKCLPTDEPLVVMAVAPVFPPIAVASNTSGEVVVEVAVDATGIVTSTRTIDGHPLLRQVRTFEDTARRWRFAPSSNSADTRIVRLTFMLRVMPKGTLPAELATVFMPPYKVQISHLRLEPVVHSDPPTYTRPSRHKKTKQAKGASFKSRREQRSA